jgi:predicted transcriptional regulator
MDNHLIKVAEHEGLYRDSQTGAIVNCDSSAYHAYIAARNKKRSERAEIDEMKKDISDIKNLLSQIASKL